MIQTPVQILNREARVCALIDMDSNWWNIPLIDSMAICPRFHFDRLIWAYSTMGSFSVQSAYHLEVQRRGKSQCSGSSIPDDHTSWASIWKLQVPRAVRLYLWRACNNILPTKDKLLRCKIVDEPNCPMCGASTESSRHSLWWCVRLGMGRIGVDFRSFCTQTRRVRVRKILPVAH
jgi:hypothetical protein